MTPSTASALPRDDRVVIVTGAAGNLGRAVADAFATLGCRLVLVDRHDHDDAPSATRLHVTADLRREDQAQQVATAALQAFGRIDVLCNVAGGFRMGEAVHATSDDTWDFLFDLNARSVVHMAHAVLPHMLARGSGKVVNVGALGALKGGAQMGAYAASKAAVMRLTETMSAEVRAQGINVNCVLPSTIDTPENRSAMPDADPGKWVAPQDLASVIVFLASDQSRAIHGALIPVAGLSG